VVAQLQAERDRITKNSNELGGLRSRLSLLDQRVSELEEEVRERPASAGASGEPERVKALEKRVQGLEDVAKKVRAGDTALREILDRQQKSVAHGGSALSEVAAGVDGLRESQERLFESLSSQETQLHELKKALDGRTEELGRVTKTLDLAMDEIARLRDVIETERTRGDTRQVVAPEGRPTEPFVSDPSPPPGPPQAAAPEPTSRDFAGDDDLEAIKGIGPKFEKALKDLGISTYAQIASWTEADVTEVAEKIGARPQRIHKDDWIAAAKKLTTRG
jgi:predicted flap endonuclease-1-like 5' DNA nuclease